MVWLDIGWGQLSQARHHWLQRIHQRQHLLFSICPAQRKAQAGAGIFAREPDRGQYMRRFDGPARTGRATRHRKALQVQTNHQRLSLNSFKQNVRRIRHARRACAIYPRPGNALEDQALQLIAQVGGRQRQVSARRTEGGDAGHVFSAGAAIALVMTAEGHLVDGHAGNQRAHALPAINLMRTERHQIRHRHGDFAQGLHGVRMHVYAMLARHREDLVQRLNRPQFVVDAHHRDERRIGPDRPPDLIRIDEPLPVHRNHRGIQLLRRRQNRGMLDGGRDDMPPTRARTGSQAAKQSQVISLRAAAGKDHLIGLAPHRRRHLTARAFQPLLRLLPEMVNGRSVARRGTQTLHHGRQGSFRNGRRRVMVKVGSNTF